MPGRHITDHQMRLFMTLRKDHPVAVAVAKAGMSPAAGYRLLKDPCAHLTGYAAPEPQHLEHRDRIEGRATALGVVAITEPAGQKRPQTFKLYRARQNLQRIAILAETLQVLRQQKQTAWVHQTSPSNAPSETKYGAANHRRGFHARGCAGVQPIPPALAMPFVKRQKNHMAGAKPLQVHPVSGFGHIIARWPLITPDLSVRFGSQFE